MRTKKVAILAGIAALVVLVAVEWILRGGSIEGLGVRTESDAPIAPGAPGWQTTVQARSLGVAGWLVRRGDDAFMSGPLYSFPRPWRLLGLGEVQPLRDAFDAHHPKDEPGVKAVFSAHAHYDHAMYVPWVLEAHPQARAYGSSTLANLVAGFGLGDRAVALDAKVDTRNGSPHGEGCAPFPKQDGEWEYVPESRLRIRALSHVHTPQVMGVYHLWPGCLDAPLDRPPSKASQWVEGPVYAYLVDFLAADGRTPEFRVYYQDSPMNGGAGRVPDDLIEERAVDLAFLGVGSFDLAENPEGIVANIRPRHVVLHHWENFFAADPRTSLRTLPLHDVAEYQRRVRAQLDQLGGERTMTITAPDVLLRFE